MKAVTAFKQHLPAAAPVNLVTDKSSDGRVYVFGKLKDRVVELAAALEEQSNIPVVHAQMVLIQEIQTDDWWQDVTLAMLENARRSLRGLIHLIEKRKRAPLYTQFEDEIGDSVEIAFERFTPPDAFEKFRAKARHFLRQHEDHVVIHKLRSNRQLTPTMSRSLGAYTCA